MNKNIQYILGESFGRALQIGKLWRHRFVLEAFHRWIHHEVGRSLSQVILLCSICWIIQSEFEYFPFCRFLINPVKDKDMRKWAIEGLSYLTLDAEVKEKLIEDREALQSLIEVAKVWGDGKSPRIIWMNETTSTDHYYVNFCSLETFLSFMALCPLWWTFAMPTINKKSSPRCWSWPNLQNVTYQSNTNWMIRISFINVSTYDEDAVIHVFFFKVLLQILDCF